MSAACLSKFWKFLKLSNKQHMGSFYAPTCKTDCLQILCKFCKNWISVPNIVHQLTLSLRCKYCKIHRCSIFPDAIVIISCFIFWYRVYLYVYSILYAINYCMFDMYDMHDIVWYELLLFLFDLCSHPICWVWSNLLYACLRTCLACALQCCDQQNDCESSTCAHGLKSTGSRGISARTIWKATGRTLSELVLLSCVVLCFDTLWNFSASLPWNRNVVVQRRTSSLSVSCRRERCCSSSDIFSRRVSSLWTLLINADHQLDDHREFREASTEAAESYRLIWSGRTVSSDLGCWTRTRHQNSSSRYLSSLVVEVRVCRSTPEDR